MAQGNSYPYSLNFSDQINYWKSEPLRKDRKSRAKKRTPKKVIRKILNNDW